MLIQIDLIDVANTDTNTGIKHDTNAEAWGLGGSQKRGGFGFSGARARGRIPKLSLWERREMIDHFFLFICFDLVDLAGLLIITIGLLGSTWYNSAF
jgi:hypothetical protein